MGSPERIRPNQGVIETWDHYGAAADRRWLETLINTLLAPETTHE